MSNFNNFSNQPYRYSLEKGSKKHHCPDCGKKRFVRFVDIETGEYLPEQYGRCDKGDGHYFLDPRKDGYAKMIWEQEQKVTGVTKVTVPKQKYFRTKAKPQPTPEPAFIDFDTFTQTLKDYDKNIFVQNLLNNIPFPFEIRDIEKVIQLYRLGTISDGYMTGAVTFPFIDIQSNVRAIQAKQFNKANHTTRTSFYHSILKCNFRNKPLPGWLNDYLRNEKKVTCLYGEHLLSKYPNADVYLFEAPKTAVYSTLYFGFPETSNIICLAVYNKSSFSFDKLNVLKRRFVYVFPDLSKEGSTFQEWEQKAKEYESRLPGTRFIFSDLLERLAPEQDREQGNDIADFLINLDWRKFRGNKVFSEDTKSNFSTPLPQWYVNAMGILQHHIAGKITGDEYWDLLQRNFEESGLSYEDYVRQNNGGLQWECEAKENLEAYRAGEFDYITYQSMQADVIIKHDLEPETLVYWINSIITNTLNN